MNRKQDVALGLGSAAMVLLHLFPPVRTPVGFSYLEWHFDFVLKGRDAVELYLPVYLAGVVTITLVTANLVALLRTRHP